MEPVRLVETSRQICPSWTVPAVRLKNGYSWEKLIYFVERQIDHNGFT